MTDELPLAAEFPPATREDWLKLVRAALKDRPFERLIAKTYDGIAVEPLYPRGSARPVAARSGPWAVQARVDHPDPAVANAEALHELENGATGLTLVCAGSLNANGYGIGGSADTLKQVLEDIYLDAGVTIDFNVSPETRDIVRHFAALVKARGIDASSVSMLGSINPMGGMAAAGGTNQRWSELAKTFAGFIGELAGQGFRGPFAAADGRIVHNAGGSEAQELAFVIASAVAYLRALEAHGIALDAARGMIYFRLAADADQFLTIAKFRAVRLLWARVEAACGLQPKPAYVSAETAWRMMTKRDPYVNLLRTTIATFSAGVGGADAVLVLPFTAALGLPDRFARRVARNIQLLLLEESNVAKVGDPTAGSGAIEDLTEKLCRTAWTQFQEIEASGGAGAALEAGIIQAKDCRGPRRARSRRGATQGFADRHQRFSQSRRNAGRGAGRAAGRGQGPVCLDSLPSLAAHPPRRAVRAPARRLRQCIGIVRRAPENLSRQSRRARRVHAARDLHEKLLRGRRHRGCRQRRLQEPRGDDRGL